MSVPGRICCYFDEIFLQKQILKDKRGKRLEIRGNLPNVVAEEETVCS